jgi:hypothetical protein
MKPLNSRDKIYLLIALVCSAMLLGSLSHTFDNKPLWWFAFIGSILSPAWCLFFLIRDIRKSDI